MDEKTELVQKIKGWLFYQIIIQIVRSPWSYNTFSDLWKYNLYSTF